MTLVEPDRPRLAPLFATDLRRHGERVAAVTPAGPVTYTGLAARVDDLADRLAGPRRLVLVAADNTLDALVAYLAALGGGHPVLLAPACDAVVRSLAAAYGPDVVLGPANGWEPEEPEERRAATARDLHPDLALLLATSGSTGSPKLVRLSRRNLEANAASIAEYLGLTPGDRAVTTLPMHYCYGLSVVNSHLLAGAGLVLTGLSVVDPYFWELFSTSGATSFAGVPHTFDLLDRVGFESMTLPGLRYVTQAGGRMDPGVVRRYAELGRRDGWELFVMYGQTEATARMAYLPPALAASHPHSIGRAIPGGELSIDDPGDDGVGELVYRGPNVMMGYAEGPADLALGATLDELLTGDLARRTPEGLHEIVGRRSRFVKPCGIRVDLDGLERLLAAHGVAAVCTGDDRRLVAAVAQAADVDAAGRLVAGRLGLPRSHVRVLVAADVPRLANGKPDYGRLRTLAEAGPGPEPEPPSAPGGAGDHRTAVRAVLSEMLGVEPADHDTFVGLGGDSLSYVETSIRLEAVLGPLPRDWHTTPVGELAPAGRARRSTVRADTSMVLRAVAIVLVVGTHADLWHVPGGAHTLLAVAGYNFARFQLGKSATRAGAFASIARIAVPSMVWIALVAPFSDLFGWPNALLLTAFLGRAGDSWAYWFVEALVQILLPLALLSAVPAVARLERRRPFGLAVAAVAAGLLVRFDVVIDLTSLHKITRPHEVFWLFALGWAAARATTGRQRVLVSALAAAALPGFFADTNREIVVLAAVALLVWAAWVPVPPLVPRLAGPVAAASLWIYLTHVQVHPPVARVLGPAAAVAASVAAGIVAWLAAGSLLGRGERRLRRARPGPSRRTSNAARRVGSPGAVNAET